MDDSPLPIPSVPYQAGTTRRHALLLSAVVALLAVGGGFVAAYWRVGHTPGELMDYAERRLEGHPRIEALALPLLVELRLLLDARSVADRARIPFVVPPPPPRRGRNEVPRLEAAPTVRHVWHVGSDGPLLSIAEAARLARSGDVVEIEAGDYHGDVAVWEQSTLTIRAVNGAARIFADGQSAEGKGIWVIRRGTFDISNIDFIGAQVDDGNGAGIRFEGGHLRVSGCLFWGNQMGLVTGGRESARDATLVIENSEFAYSHVPGKWGHNLYVGTISSLTVTGSYFHHAGIGHLLKSPSRASNVFYNRITDESGGRASYELDFPNGGMVRVVGNVIQQQRYTEHSTLIAYGREGSQWPLNTLQMGSNTLVNDHPHGGTFLHVASGADRVEIANNLLVGPGDARFKIA